MLFSGVWCCESVSASWDQGALTQLEQLGLDLNPVASLPDYREKVFNLLPSLVILDSKDKQGEEREAADSDSEEEDGKRSRV